MQEHTEATRETRRAQENDRNQPRLVGGLYQNCRWARTDPAHSPRRLFPQSPPEMASHTFIPESVEDLPNPVSPNRDYLTAAESSSIQAIRTFSSVAAGSVSWRRTPWNTNRKWRSDPARDPQEASGRLEDHLPATPARFCPADSEPAEEGSSGSCILDPHTHHVTPLKECPGLSTIWLSTVHKHTRFLSGWL